MAVYINDNIACSSMITNAQVHRIAEEFDLVVSLAEVHELKYNPKKFSELGVEYIIESVKEFSVPNILRFFKLAYRIYNKVLGGGKVLIHCSGGYSRSRTLALT